MSGGREHIEVGGGSRESSFVRFCEYIADKMAAGRVVMGLDRKELARPRLCPAEAAALYAQVSTLVAGGTDAHEACHRVGVRFDGYRQWAWRKGRSVRKQRGRAGA